MQAAAREARYALLAAHAREIGADALVTAHTLDDQAETVLMRLAAGSGVAGLGAMAPRSETLGLAHLRPLLDIPKARLAATCRRLALSFAEDPGNLSARFARGRWRAARAVLAEEGLTPGRLAALARRARAADEAIRTMAAAALAEASRGEALDMRRLADQPEAVVVAALGRWLGEGEPGPVRLARLEACAGALSAAAREARRETRTLAGQVLTLRRDGLLIRQAEARRRGIVNPVAGPKLGNGPARP